MKINKIENITWYTKNNFMPWVVCMSEPDKVDIIVGHTDFNVIHIENDNISDLLKIIAKSDRAKRYVYVIGTDIKSSGEVSASDGVMFQDKLETFFRAYGISFYTHAMLKDEQIEKDFIEQCKTACKKPVNLSA